jgi:hypothetical protein
MTDEPDGTTGYEASLQPPGHVVQTGEEDDGTRGDLAPDDTPEGSRSVGEGEPSEVERAGYDVDAVSGDTGRYRPE